MSSSKLAESVALGGIFSTSKKNPFAAANVAYLPYCSSDAWVGDVAASPATFGFHFRGQRILAATLTALVRAHGLGGSAAGPAQRLLLSGCSAGARGALFNLDYVSDILGEAGVAAGAVTVTGLLDSPLWVAMEPATPHIMPLTNETEAIFTFLNATGRLGTACSEAYPGTEGWRCLFGQYRLPYVTTPYLLNAAQYDRFELPYNIGGQTQAGFDVQSWHPAQLAYAEAFGPAILAVLATLPAAGQERSAVFSSACFRHCVTDSAAFWNVAVVPPPSAKGKPSPPVSLRDAAQEWFFGRPPQPLRVVASCSGFRCGNCSTRELRAAQAAARSGFGRATGRKSAGKLLLLLLLVLSVAFITLACLVRIATAQARAAPRERAPERLPRVVSLRDRYGTGARGKVPQRFGSGSETTRLLDDL